MYRKILVATDGSEHSRRAVHRAAELALCTKAAVTLVTVLHMPASYLMALGSSIGMGSEPWAVLRRSSEQILNEAQALLSTQGIQVQSELEMGDPGEEIVRLAREGGYDLIIAGSRGRRQTKAYLLGSVSARISHQAPCDLLIVH